MAWLAGWNYRKQIAVAGTTAGQQTNYAILSKLVRNNSYHFTKNAVYYPSDYPSILPMAFYNEGTNNRTFIAYAGGSPTSIDYYAMHFDHVTKKWSKPTLVFDGALSKDLHYNPTIICNIPAKNSGKVACFYGKYDGAKVHYYWKLSSAAEDTSAWGEENDFGDCIYPKLVRDSSGNIYLFHNLNTDQGQFSVAKSTDGAATFGAVSALVNLAANKWLYVYGAAVDNTNGKVWFHAMQYDYPGGNYNNEYVFYYKFSDGKLYSAGGTCLTDAASPVDQATLDSYAKVYTSTVNYPGCIKLDSNGNPYFVSWDSAASTIRFYKWTGSAWSELANAPGLSDFDIHSATDIDMYFGGSGVGSIYHFNGTAWAKSTDLTFASGRTIASAQSVTNLPDNVIFNETDTGGTLTNLRLYAMGEDLLEDIAIPTETSKVDFTDVRFTSSDGETLIDHWIDSGTLISGLEVECWFEVPTIPASPGSATIYVYYGKEDATDVSSGSNTFTVFDDFERGNNGDPLGGSWTIVQGDLDISTAQKWGGTRSAKIIADPSASYASIPVVGGDNVAIRCR